MKRFSHPAAVLACLLYPAACPTAHAQQQAGTVTSAVVRIPSHGCSGTVIYTETGRTYILSCGHGWQIEDGSRYKPIKLNLPAAIVGEPKKVGVTLVDTNYADDLSLLVLASGPVDFVCPVAPHHHRPGPHLLSVGYDEMRMPPVQLPAHIVMQTTDITFTAEAPWHGRSGGALIDLDRGSLIGVVSGYETNGRRRGMYVSHDTICQFLEAYYTRSRQPEVMLDPRPMIRGYLNPSPCPTCPGGSCPIQQRH
jgi:hypothetical protein